MSFTIAVIWSAVLILCGASLWIRRLRRRQNPFIARSGAIVDPPKMATAPNADALVYVNEDGSVRELTEAERTYVAIEFSPLDGARPYVKSRYSDRTAWGIQGHLPRAEVPDGVSIDPPPPPQDTPQPQTPQAVSESLSERIRKHGRS
jgi:hypothetical protein